MAARSRGNRTYFDWLRKSCDISTCDLSPDRNPEKYGRPMKSAIFIRLDSAQKLYRFNTTMQLANQYTPMKHFQISCQRHKIDSMLLSSRCMTNYMNISTCSFL